MKFHPNTIRGFVFGAIFGTVFGAGVVAPKFVDMVGERIVAQVKVDPDLAAALVRQIPRVMEEQAAAPALMKLNKAEAECLARNIFFEAGVEDVVGKIAVGQVTINRMKDGRWGDTICEVVYSKAQFSWTLFSKKRNETPEGPLWEESVRVAQDVMRGTRHVELQDALFYHTDYIKTPIWASDNFKITQVGQHIFYTKALTADDLKKVKLAKIKAQQPKQAAAKTGKHSV